MLKGRLYFLLYCLLGLSFANAFGQPLNDEPCSAVPLFAGDSCTYASFQNIDATFSEGAIPNPLCGGFNVNECRDVWFVVAVPSSGAVVIDQLEGTLDNTSMAAYTAPSCSGPFTLLSCDADDSGNGRMPFIILVDQPPGSLIYIRVWDNYQPANPFGAPEDPTEQGSFSICAQRTPGNFSGMVDTTGFSYTCETTPPAGNTCETATPICTFDGYCASTEGYTADYWYEGSDGLGGPLTAQGIFCGSIENNSFLSFIAGSSTVELEVEVTGDSEACDDGIQFMMFGDPTGAPACGSLNLDSYGCESPMPPGINIFMGYDMTPGTKYYLMIDGFAGDVCNYQINALSGVAVSLNAGPDKTACLGDPVELTIYGVVASSTILWDGPHLNTNSGPVVVTSPPQTGTYEYIVTVAGGETLCQGTDTILVHVVSPPLVSIDTSLCENDSITLTATGAVNYLWEPADQLGTTTGPSIQVSPTEVTEYTVTGYAATGCPASATVSLAPCDSTGCSVVYYDLNHAGCSGDGYSVTVNGTEYNEANPSGVEIFTGGSTGGCDSVVTVELIFNPVYEISIPSATCDPADTGTVVLNFQSEYGCDSIVTIATGLLPSDTVYLYLGSCAPADTGTVVHLYLNQYGCDSLVITSTDLLPPSQGTVGYAGCIGDGYQITVNGTLYDESNPVGVETLTGAAANGCDSLVYVDLVFDDCPCPPVEYLYAYEGCAGDGFSLSVNGTIYDQFNPDGMETFIGASADGCDSVVTVDLTFYPQYGVDLLAFSCFPGDTGEVVMQLTSAYGCDSIVTVHTELLPSDSAYLQMESCNSADTGIFNFSYLNQYGCDSVVIVDVSLLPNYSIQISETSCDPADTGTAVLHLFTAEGCDSIITTVTTYDETAFGSLSGYVYFDGSPIDTGQVRLIRKDGNSPQTMMDVDIVYVAPDGSFTFGAIPEGTYLLKALGDTSAFEHVATYADSTNHWQKARKFELSTCDTVIEDAIIHLIDFPATIGFGNIDGTITQGSGGGRWLPSGHQSVGGDPLPGIQIALERLPEGVVSKGAVSNEAGEFTLRNIANGVYTLWADIEGYVVDTTVTLAFADGQDITYYIEMCVDTLLDSIGYCSVSIISSTVDQWSENVHLYPNPTKGEFILSDADGRSFDLTITDLNGALLSRHEQLSGMSLVDVSHLPPGIYIIRLADGEKYAYRKLVIQY